MDCKNTKRKINTWPVFSAGIIRVFFILMGAVICLGACSSSAAVRDNRPFVYLTDNSKFFLLPPDGIEKNMDTVQLISASYWGRNFVFNAWVKADETEMLMSLFNELGAGIGELSYKDGIVSFSSTVFPKFLKPEYIIADFQLCFYNTFLLSRALEGCGLVLEIKENSRRILTGKTVIIEIEKKGNTVKLVNFLRGYSYTLEGDFQ